MSDFAITTANLGKRYRIGEGLALAGSLRERLSEAASRLVRTAWSRSATATAEDSYVWALRNVDLQVNYGEVLGIIGGNGAGKSTLLKVLSRITHPTEGRAQLHGRIGSLLEVGTGFHPELTGRENVYLNGAILGMSREEVTRKFDAIVAFAEVSRFIDTPVKHYSSGMYVRLAFAVAAHLETEILVVDEVLAVGDLRFQKKCIGQLNEVARGGRTVLFVSHNMDAVQRLCTRGLLLEQGRPAAHGSIQDVVRTYRERDGADHTLGVFRSGNRRTDGWAVFTDARLMAGSRRVGSITAEQELTFELDIAVRNVDQASDSLRGLVVELVVQNDDGQPLFSVMNVDRDALELPAARSCTIRVAVDGPTLVPGRYRLNVFLGWPYLEHVDEIPEALEFEVVPPITPWRPYPLHPMRGHVCKSASWSCLRTGNHAAAKVS
jgi:lipopolysaccharide transport system ATP-binding protein